MPKAYSDDLRVRIVRAVDAGASRRSTAGKFEVSVSFVIRLVQQWRASGNVKVRGTGGRPRHKLEPHAELVGRLLAATRDITLDELCCALAGEGVKASRSGLDRYLRACGLTRKKRLHMPPSRNGPMSPPRGKPGASARAS